MNYKKIILKVEDHVASLTLNRPEKLNALDSETMEELKTAFDEVRENDDARVLVITGAGRAFCAGGDIETHPAVHARIREKILPQVRRGQEVILKLTSLPMPVIAAINGMALGAGCDLACACDIRLASEKAIFAEVFVQIGAVPDYGGTYFLPRLIGTAKSCELIFSGDPIDAKEAEKIGMVNKVVSHDLLENITKEFAQKLATSSQLAIRKSKAAIYEGLNRNLASQLEAEANAQAECGESADTQKRIRAFVERQKPTSKT